MVASVRAHKAGASFNPKETPAQGNSATGREEVKGETRAEQILLEAAGANAQNVANWRGCLLGSRCLPTHLKRQAGETQRHECESSRYGEPHIA